MKKPTNAILKIILQYFLFFSLSHAYAQQGQVSAGGNAIGIGGSSSFSIGQVNYTSATGSNGSAHQGLQQPFEIITLGKDDFPSITLMMTIYPNPTTSFVILNIGNYGLENLNFQLFDINGRQILSQRITTSETQIQMENLALGIYLIHVLDNGQVLKTFKIIKNN